jgi:hypothetical protein
VLKIIKVGDVSEPAIFCDVCTKQITAAGEAAAVYPYEEKDGAVLEVLHVHKGRCHDTAENKVGSNGGAPWQELESHLLWLLKNTGLPLDRLGELEADEKEFGLSKP